MKKQLSISVIKLIFACFITNIINFSLYAESLFLPPQNEALYKKSPLKLNDSEYWRIKIFGLRMVPLDPTIWALRKVDRTDNRRLVPIRPFYLRQSEKQNFLLEQVDINFSFSKVTAKEAMRVPFRKDALLEIEFAGRYRESLPYQDPKEDSAYGVRLSAFPNMPSGFYFRSYNNVKVIEEFMPNQIESGKQLDFSLKLDHNRVIAILSGIQLGEIKGRDLRRGLVSLETGWHPVSMNKLSLNVKSISSNGEVLEHVLSGLITIPGSAPPKSKTSVK